MKLGPGFATTLAAARTGSQAAWEELYRSIAPDLFGYLRARRIPDAEDVIGETFLQVVRDLARFNGEDEDGFRAWTFTIASHRASDHLRILSRRQRTEAERDPHELPELPVGTAEDEVLSIAAAREALSLLDALPDAQRRVILLRVFGGFRTVEIARIEGMLEATARSHLRRGLRRLERMVRSDGDVGATNRPPFALS